MPPMESRADVDEGVPPLHPDRDPDFITLNQPSSLLPVHVSDNKINFGNIDYQI